MEHPEIRKALATGYHKFYKPFLCDACKGVIQPGEAYGTFDGRNICIDCTCLEWNDLTPSERFRALGYDVKTDELLP